MKDEQRNLEFNTDGLPLSASPEDMTLDELLLDVKSLLAEDHSQPEGPVTPEPPAQEPVVSAEAAPTEDQAPQDALSETAAAPAAEPEKAPEKTELDEVLDLSGIDLDAQMDLSGIDLTQSLELDGIDIDAALGLEKPELQPEPEAPAAPEEIPEPEPAEDVKSQTGTFPPLTFYEQSRPAYQTARRAQYEREREEKRLRLEQERLAREEAEAQKMWELEQRHHRRKKVKKSKAVKQTTPQPGTEAYAQWLYEQGEDEESVAQRESLKQQELDHSYGPPKKHIVRNVLLVLLALVVVATACLVIFAQQPVNPDSWDPRVEGSSTILLAGVDRGGYRTDTMLLLNVNRETGRISLVSIPRDTLIYCEYDIPKLNSAYGWAGGDEEGMEELMLRISEIIGYEPDGYVVIGMEALESLVDKMGGIRFEVPMDMDYEDPSQDLSIHLEAGAQSLNGEEALQLLRYRAGYPTADLGRVDMQRQVISAALDQWVSPIRIPALPGAINLLRKNTFSNLTTANYLWLIQTVMVCNRTDIQTATLPGTPTEIAGGSYYVLDAPGVAETINSYCNPYQNGIAVSDLYLRVG